MATKAIKESPKDRPPRAPYSPEDAPSPVRDDDMNVGRFIGLVSGCVVFLSGIILILNYAYNYPTVIGPGWAGFGLVGGLAGLLFHAAFDRDVEFRRIYMGVGFGLTVLGAIVAVVPYKAAGDLFGLGYVGMVLGLLFQIAFLRNETVPQIRDVTQYALGGVGALLAVVGLLLGYLLAESTADFLLPSGLLLALLGLAFLVACVSVKGTSDEWSYRIGLAIGGLGAFVVVLALVRSLLPGWFRSSSVNFLLPWGLLLMTMGVVYILTAIGLVSDNRVVVMTRREIGAFFYSPVAYMVLFAFTIVHWLAYYMTVSNIWEASNPGLPQMGMPPEPPVFEPIVPLFLLQWIAVFANVFVVPALTMRLVSEERRTGTLEVLLTTPVNEVGVVLSKFFAALLMYLVMWVPFGLLLVALRVGGGREFDYRPLLGFSVCLLITGANFVSMGLFFSSLTRNQIVSAVLTFTGMLTLTMVFLIKANMSRGPSSGAVGPTILEHISYIDIWINTLQGRMVPRYLLFHLTATILWLFGAVKVLDARKWS